MDPRVERLADVLVNYSTGVRPGDWVTIDMPPLAEPLAVACQEAVLRAGGNGTVNLISEAAREAYLREANDEQLAFVSPVTRVTVEQVDVSIACLAPTNTRSLSGIPPERMAARNAATRSITETMFTRMGDGSYRWTITQFPTAAAAQDAGMSLRDYEDFVYGAYLLNDADPPAAWRALGERQQRLVDWLSDKSEVRISGPGVDLTVGIAGRTWINDDGHYNFPGGEVFTAPVEDATEGTVQFNYPATLGSREVDGVRLRYEQGRVVELSAARDETYLQQMLDLDTGARCLGEFAIGTNPGIQNFSHNTLFDEKISGTVHMALGASIPGTGGQNESALHWDMVLNLREGFEVRVDGELFSRDGQILVADANGM